MKINYMQHEGYRRAASGAEFNMTLDTLYVIWEPIFPANCLTGAETSLPNKLLGWYY